MTTSPDRRVVQSFANPTGTSTGFQLPGGWYALVANGDGSDDSNNNPPTITVQIGTTVLATLTHCTAGTNSTSIPGLRIPPVGFDYAEFASPDGPAQTLTVVVVTGANGAIPKDVLIYG